MAEPPAVSMSSTPNVKKGPAIAANLPHSNYKTSTVKLTYESESIFKPDPYIGVKSQYVCKMS